MWDFHLSGGIPMGMGTKLLKLMGIGQELKYLRWGMRTLINNAFPFSPNFPSKILI